MSSTRTEPVSALEDDASGVVNALQEHRQPVVITVDGEARAVLQDIASYEATQETLALLQIVAMGERDIAAGKTVPLNEAFDRVRRRQRG
jgi:prevent-host-death family protein